MKQTSVGEKWQNVALDFEHGNNNRIEVSNLGRIRSFNVGSDGNILKGSITNGYKIIRMKFFTARDTAMTKKIISWQKQVVRMAKEVRELQLNGEKKAVIKEATDKLNHFKKEVSKKIAADVKKRTINYHALVHRLVAQYFLKQPTANHTIVGHLDHDKLNNTVKNLKWMTPDENYVHQQSSPKVIEEKRSRKFSDSVRNHKLTVTKVMLLKKLLLQGKPIKQLVKQFKVTDTQIIRIKKGENWASVKAAD